MEALLILSGISLLALIIWGGFSIHRYSDDNFLNSPFSIITIVITFVCVLLIAIGVYIIIDQDLVWYNLNSIVLFGASLIGFIFLYVYLIRKTNYWIATISILYLGAWVVNFNEDVKID